MGSNNDAKDIYYEQQRAERARERSIAQATGRVNAVFDAPERLAGREDFLAALRDNYMRDLNRQKGLADRRLKFSMARSGLSGGSASVDANRTLGEDFTEGLLDAENRSQAGLADLEAQDEQSRLNILQMVRQGLDSTTAAQRAGAAMRTNIESTKTQNLMNGLGEVFGNTAGIYKQQQEAQERRRGARDAGVSIYGPKSNYA
jgi:hypothetical protein